MHPIAEWASILQQADAALVKLLAQHGVWISAESFRMRLHEYYAQRDRDFQETTYHFVLRELLKGHGYAEVDESILRSALDALYAITQTNWQLESDSLETIRQLKENQYRLGILSNAGDDKDVQQLIDRFGIREYFDFVLTSAACFYRKPHPRAFEIALAHWNITPGEAIMIGDSLEADIQGAKDLGMKTIWLTRRAQCSADEMQRIQPDFSLGVLTEVFPTLERINLSPA